MKKKAIPQEVHRRLAVRRRWLTWKPYSKRTNECMSMLNRLSYALSWLSLLVLPILLYWVGLVMEAFQLSADYSHFHRLLVLFWGLPALVHLYQRFRREQAGRLSLAFVRLSGYLSILVSGFLLSRGLLLETPFALVPSVYLIYVFYLIHHGKPKSVC